MFDCVFVSMITTVVEIHVCEQVMVAMIAKQQMVRKVVIAKVVLMLGMIGAEGALETGEVCDNNASYCYGICIHTHFATSVT
jgi:hypothetical protein